MENKQIYSIGYEGASIEAFIKILLDEHVQRIVDVRERAFSFKKGFSKKPLIEALQAAGIDYVNPREIAPPREMRKSYESVGDFEGFCTAYRAHLEAEKDLLETFIGSLKPGDCLLCFEKNHERCHRKILESFIAMTVKNLRDDA